MSSHEWSNDNIYESYFGKTMFFLSKILFRSFFLVQVYAKRQIFRKNSCSNIWMGEFSKAFEKSNQKRGSLPMYYCGIIHGKRSEKLFTKYYDEMIDMKNRWNTWTEEHVCCIYLCQFFALRCAHRTKNLSLNFLL